MLRLSCVSAALLDSRKTAHNSSKSGLPRVVWRKSTTSIATSISCSSPSSYSSFSTAQDCCSGIFFVGRVLLCDDEDDVWSGFHTKWMYLVLFLQKELKRPIGTNDPLLVVFGS